MGSPKASLPTLMTILLRNYYFLGLAFAATSVTQFSPVRVAFYDVATKLSFLIRFIKYDENQQSTIL